VDASGPSREPVDGCVFCDIVRHKAPAHIVYETAETLAFFPVDPATTGHTLVIPRWHVTDFLDADAETIGLVAATAARVARVIRDIVRPQGTNLITSAGPAASQTVFHLHLHIVPRWAGDPIGDIWPPATHTPAGQLDDLASRIRAACG
jgi:histidine triad (HIT) family protein